VDSPERLLTIGQFARACGLTAKALRHYDATGLLPPAFVDPGTGYRRYSEDQVEAARSSAGSAASTSRSPRYAGCSTCTRRIQAPWWTRWSRTGAGSWLA